MITLIEKDDQSTRLVKQEGTLISMLHLFAVPIALTETKRLATGLLHHDD